MYSTKEYKRGLTIIRNKLNDKHYDVFRAQYYSPNRTITAPQLAKALGYSHFSAANLLYGKLGKLISLALDKLPPKRWDGSYSWWQVLSSGVHSKEMGFQWVMRPQLAKALEELEIVTESETILPEEIRNIEHLKEGATYRIIVNAYERNPEARSICIAHYGTQCVACGFNFGEIYGESGEGYIHVHHLRRLSEIGEEYEVNPIKDLRPICPNCHAMIHRREPPYTIKEIQFMLKDAKQNNAV